MPDEVKGMGSAFGGEWKPKKPEDERFLGKPEKTKDYDWLHSFVQRFSFSSP